MHAAGVGPQACPDPHVPQALPRSHSAGPVRCVAQLPQQHHTTCHVAASTAGPTLTWACLVCLATSVPNPQPGCVGLCCKPFHWVCLANSLSSSEPNHINFCCISCSLFLPAVSRTLSSQILSGRVLPCLTTRLSMQALVCKNRGAWLLCPENQQSIPLQHCFPGACIQICQSVGSDL